MSCSSPEVAALVHPECRAHPDRFMYALANLQLDLIAFARHAYVRISQFS